jgi:hypothetical protein
MRTFSWSVTQAVSMAICSTRAKQESRGMVIIEAQYSEV